MFLKFIQSITVVVFNIFSNQRNSKINIKNETNTYHASISNNKVIPVEGKSHLLMIVSNGIINPIRVYMAIINVSLIIFLFCFAFTNSVDFLIPRQKSLTTTQINVIKSINCIIVPVLLFIKSFIVLVVVLMSKYLNLFIRQYKKRKDSVCS